MSHRVISTILRHDAKQTSYKIALLRALNDAVLAYPDVRFDGRAEFGCDARRAYTSGTMALPVRDRTETLERLAELQPQLRALGVVSLRLFGSAGRDAMNATSDVDVLVEFEHPVGVFEFLDVRELLADTLGRPVDLVTPAAVKPWMRERVEREAVRAA